MSCDSEKAAMNEAYHAWRDARDAAQDIESRLADAIEKVEYSCGYYERDRYVLDPLEPSELPPGMPLCPDAFKEWWDAYLEMIQMMPLYLETQRLEALMWETYKEWSACEHQNKYFQPA
jgi:hypothetical protein